MRQRRPSLICVTFQPEGAGIVQVGFFFWPYTPELCERLAERADRYGYAMIGIADTPGNAMDPWVSAAIAAPARRPARVAICVTNLITPPPPPPPAATPSPPHPPHPPAR